MRGSLTIARRELLSLFCSPVAYVVVVVFLGLNGFFFGVYDLIPGSEASLRQMFTKAIPNICVFVLPVLTMRALSEEFRSGTIETLMTAPVQDAAVIAGKFIGIMAFYGLLLAGTIPQLVAIASFGDPDWGAVITGYLGMILVAAFCAAVGLFFSSCTTSQIVAVLCSLLTLMTVQFLIPLAILYFKQLSGIPRTILQHLSLSYHITEFVQGTISLNNVAFFVTSTGVMLFMATKTLESRRWR
jgi:ABC-2 type transport system permease protein